MEEEIFALLQNATWDLVPLPFGKLVVGCRVNPDSIVDGLKACLVAKGRTQIYGVGYSETFSLVAKIASIQLFISLAAINQLLLH